MEKTYRNTEQADELGKINEEFLCYVWQHGLYDMETCRLSDNSIFSVEKVGLRNTDAGPDFENAAIRMGDITWCGQVEVHCKASDWFKHAHEQNKVYDNIVLHVVYQNDVEVKRSNGEPIPTLELRGKINKAVLKEYLLFMEEQTLIPCASHIAEVDLLRRNMWIERLAIERLESKTEMIHKLLSESLGDWKECLYKVIAGAFGLRLNMQPFEWVARSLPLNVVEQYKCNLLQIEALLFGQAGFLEEVPKGDEYAEDIQQRYKVLQKKHHLKPLEDHVWSYFRLRPQAFPHIRLSQFAYLLSHFDDLYNNLMSATSVKQLYPLLQAEASEYWQLHYMFGRELSSKTKKVGQAIQDVWIINAVVPYMFVYGAINEKEEYERRALDILREMKCENNNVVRMFEEMGIFAHNAYEGQALLHLKRTYCDYRRCLQCVIGNNLLLSRKLTPEMIAKETDEELTA